MGKLFHSYHKIVAMIYLLKMSFYEVPRFGEKYLIQSTDPKTTKL